MKRILVNRVTAVIVFVAILLCVPMVAYAYPASYRLNYPSVTQEQTNWCWAACACSVIEYYGGDVEQEEFVTALWGDPFDFTATLYQVQQGLSNYSISSTVVFYPLTLSQIRTNTYSNRRPVIATVAWSTGGSHDLVVIGYGDYGTSGDQYVVYMDPADGGIYTMEYSRFVESDTQEWAESLINIY